MLEVVESKWFGVSSTCDPGTLYECILLHMIETATCPFHTSWIVADVVAFLFLFLRLHTYYMLTVCLAVISGFITDCRRVLTLIINAFHFLYISLN